MIPTVFYFDFYDNDSETSIVKGFIINADLLGQQLSDISEDSAFTEHIEIVESDYGVHDWSSSPCDQVNGIGFTSYEIDKSEIDNVMLKHRQFFSDLVGEENVTLVVTVSTDISAFDDYEIFLAIQRQSDNI